MYPWQQASGQMVNVLSGGFGQMGQLVDYQQRACGAGMAYPHLTGNSLPTGIGNLIATGDDLYIDDTEAEAEEVKLKVEEPPDEFTQLSNHKFHELLDRFHKLT